jgi:hypothetical protein
VFVVRPPSQDFTPEPGICYECILSEVVLGAPSAEVSDFVDGKVAQTKLEGEKTWDPVTADEVRQSAFAFPIEPGASSLVYWRERSEENLRAYEIDNGRAFFVARGETPVGVARRIKK